MGLKLNGPHCHRSLQAHTIVYGKAIFEIAIIEIGDCSKGSVFPNKRFHASVQMWLIYDKKYFKIFFKRCLNYLVSSQIAVWGAE